MLFAKLLCAGIAVTFIVIGFYPNPSDPGGLNKLFCILWSAIFFGAAYLIPDKKKWPLEPSTGGTRVKKQIAIFVSLVALMAILIYFLWYLPSR